MGYHDEKTGNRRAFAIGAVAIIHGVAGYALLTGLAVRYMQDVMPVLEARNIPVEVPPPVSAPPPDTAVRDARVPLPQQPILLPRVPLADAAIDLPPLPPPGDYFPRERFDPPPAPPTQAFTPRRASPSNSPGAWATSYDYPARDLREGNQGVTRFSLTVGADGRVQSCTVVQSSGFAGLDEATCRHVSRRARFRPATDAGGLPAAGEYMSSIRWEIPED